MSYQPVNNVTTQDHPTDAATLLCPGALRVNIDSSGAAIYYQLGDGVGGINWRPPVYMAPAFRSMDRRCDAVRVYSAQPGTPASVTLEAMNSRDLGGNGG